MELIEKTVFLCYRRSNIPWALAIFQTLTHHGYDVFFDFNGIASGDFERVILGNIHARAHFLVLLAPSALERCSDPADWLRREIETAIEYKRNIVPLMLESFDFGTPGIAGQLTGQLATLQHYNSLRVHADYFDEAMGRLRDRYLNVALDGVLHPASPSVRQAARAEQASASAAPTVTERELTAQEWFERGYNATGQEEKLRFYDEAIRLKSDYAEAFNNRGLVRKEMGDLEGALQDYNEALRAKPGYSFAFINRAVARKAKEDLDGALADYAEAIRAKSDDPDAFYGRANVFRDKGDTESAFKDYAEAVRLKPDYANAYYNRALIWQKMNKAAAAIADFRQYLNVGGGERDGDTEKVEEMIRDLEKKK